MPTKSDSPLSEFELIDSPIDQPNQGHCLLLTDIQVLLIVTFVTFNQMVMLVETDNAIKYIKTKPLHIE